jgi:hypothetical protein
VIGRRNNKRKNVGASQQIAIDREGEDDRLQGRSPRPLQGAVPWCLPTGEPDGRWS